MKPSEKFRTAIEDYLKDKALKDSLFAPAFAKASKSLEQCLHYIISEVKKTGECAFDASEIFSIAEKYYTDDAISAVKEIKCQVMVNQPQKADLFSCAPPISAPAPKAQKTPAAEAPTPLQTELTLFDL